MRQADLNSFSYADCPRCGSRFTNRDGKYSRRGRHAHRFRCKRCNYRFVPPKTDFAVKAWAIHAYTEIGVTLERVAKEVFDLFNVRVTLVTIRNWVLNAERVQNNFKHAAGGVWHVDETVIHSNGEKWWIWIVVERRARRVLAWLVSNNRRKKNARRVFEKAVAAAGGLPSIIVSDGYKGYASVFKRYDVVHVVDSAFGFNALIERVNREVKKRLKYFKCNVSKKLVEALLAAWFAAYHARFHHGLGCTPLEAGAAATSTKL